MLTVARPVPADGLTAASLVRLKAVAGPTSVLLDEMGDALALAPELDQILRSGFQRSKRYIKLHPLPDGTYLHETHDVFSPVRPGLYARLPMPSVWRQFRAFPLSPRNGEFRLKSAAIGPIRQSPKRTFRGLRAGG